MNRSSRDYSEDALEQFQSEAANIARIDERTKSHATKEEVANVRTEIETLRTKIQKVGKEIAQSESKLTWRIIIIAILVQAIGVGVIFQMTP